MDYSENLNLYLPSRDTDDIVDVNQISENFIILDNEIGNVESSLDSIIAIQNSLIGGDSV